MHMQFVLISCANSTTQLGRRTFVSLMAALRTCGARQLFESRWRCDVLINYNTSETLRLLRTRCVRGTALERDGCCFFFNPLCPALFHVRSRQWVVFICLMHFRACELCFFMKWDFYMVYVRIRDDGGFYFNFNMICKLLSFFNMKKRI